MKLVETNNQLLKKTTKVHLKRDFFISLDTLNPAEKQKQGLVCPTFVHWNIILCFARDEKCIFTRSESKMF